MSVEPFIICALPRSRTCWLANFLSNGRIQCAHDLCAEEATPAAIARRLLAREFPELPEGMPVFSGVADTGAALFLEELLRLMPQARLVVVLRDPAEVMEEMARLGFGHAAAAIPVLWHHLKEAGERPRAFLATTAHLGTLAGVRAVQEHVAPGASFEEERARMLIDFNVQLLPEALQRGIEGGAQFQHSQEEP